MIVIICAKYTKNPSRTVDATELTRFSKSRSNDHEDIGQGQRSSHATHLLMLVIICTKYGKNPSRTVDATGRTRKVNGQTDRDKRTDGRTDRQTGWIQYIPLTSLRGGYNKQALIFHNEQLQLPVQSQFWEIKGNANISLYVLKIYHQLEVLTAPLAACAPQGPLQSLPACTLSIVWYTDSSDPNDIQSQMGSKHADTFSQ